MTTQSPFASRPVALVTGASQGLGAHLAKRLVENGYNLAVHYRSNREGAERLKAELLAKGLAEVILVAGDLSEEGVAENIVQTIDSKWQRLNLLVANQGTYRPIPLADLSADTWREGLQSTVTSTFFAVQAALPLMRLSALSYARNDHPYPPRILVLGDSSCDRPTARDLALSYHIGKTGVLMLCKSFAQAEARFGITVNCLSPGYLENSEDLPPAQTLPSQTYVTLEEVWRAVAFLIGPGAASLTGTNLVLSGGWNLR